MTLKIGNIQMLDSYTLDMVLKYFLELTSTLKHLSSQNVLLNNSNIFVCIKLLEFDILKSGNKLELQCGSMIRLGGIHTKLVTYSDPEEL